jgi:hypothetical protein
MISFMSWIRSIMRRKVVAGSIVSSQSVASINDNAARALCANRKGETGARAVAFRQLCWWYLRATEQALNTLPVDGLSTLCQLLTSDT